MSSFLIILLCLSAFISAWTLGLSIISKEGMILYPFRRWLLSFKQERRKELVKLLSTEEKEKKRIVTDSTILNKQLEVDRCDDNIAQIKWEQFKLDWWHKPIITCSPCMCSLHGILISVYFIILTDWKTLAIAPFSILLSVVINKKFG